MTFHGGVRPWAVEHFVSPLSRSGYGQQIGVSGSAASSATYPAANRAYYYPVVLASPCTIYRLWWLNGATVGTDNIQVGIYYDTTDGPGDAFLRGTSTGTSGANVCQFDNVTDTQIPAGRWWIAIWCNGTTTTVFRIAPGTTHARYWQGFLESSIAGGLPTNATPAQNTSTYVPVFGFSTRASP